MTRIIFLNFFRSKIVLLLLLVLFSIGLLSIGIGYSFFKKQEIKIAETSNYQKEHIARLLKYENKEFGLFMYYAKFTFVNPLSKLSALSIGQRDIHSGVQSITIRNLEGQKYDAGIDNPYQLMTGTIDLSFVIIYLFPLVIIALCFNVLSEEKENGTWSLVQIQSGGGIKYLFQKLVAPVVSIISILGALFLLAKVFLKISFDIVFIAFVVTNFLYILFWFAVIVLVISFNKASSFNAISLVSIWILLCLLLPAAINRYVSAKYPVPESLETMIKQRDGYHTKWDISKDSTMQLFKTIYPKYREYKWQNESFDWLWYYAMQHLGDDAAKQDQQLFYDKLTMREDATKKIAYLVPTIYTQLYNNELAESDLANQLEFLQETTMYHEKLRFHFYPKIFTAASVFSEDWNRYEPVYFNSTRKFEFGKAFYLLIFIVFIGSIGLIRLKSSINVK